jgi:CRP/FNR family transcriptional regulator, dissimilatory nitrate respiration regulator
MSQNLPLTPISDLFCQSESPPYSAGQVLFRTGQRVAQMYLVLQGRVELQRHTRQGAILILQNAGPGSILAEASAYSSHYHCDAQAAEPTQLAVLAKSAFLAALDKEPLLARAWSCLLANSVQAARMRAEIRSLSTVASRLEAWLEQGNVLPQKGHWQSLAAELSVSREALYRELARRRAKAGAV